jgi:uncharacterized protein (DUF1778 family)
MSEAKNKNIQLRVTEKEKVVIENKAASCSMPVSDLLRTAVLREDKVIILSEGGIISQKLIKLVTEIQNANKSNNMIKGMAY